MAKKLMMNNYSENGMLPIIDGLVCWLDGRDYSGGGLVKDRVGSNKFVTTNITSTGYSFLYNNTSSLITTTFNDNEDMYKLFNSDFTLCITEKISKPIANLTYPRLVNFNEYETNSPYQLIYQPDSDKKSMQFCNSKIESYSVFKSIDICNDVSKKNIVFVKRGNQVIFYKNGEKYETILDDSNADINLFRITIGQAYNATNTRAYSGDIYSFMAYNRALTEEEIQYNYLYEQSIDRGE